MHTHTHTLLQVSSFVMGYSAINLIFKKNFVVWLPANLSMAGGIASGLHPVVTPLQRLSTNCFFIGPQSPNFALFSTDLLPAMLFQTTPRALVKPTWALVLTPLTCVASRHQYLRECLVSLSTRLILKGIKSCNFFPKNILVVEADYRGNNDFKAWLL